MIFILYIVVFASSVGLVDLAPALKLPSVVGMLNASDILVAILFIATIPGYLKERKKTDNPRARGLEHAWIAFMVILVVGSLNSPATSLRDHLSNLRFVEPFTLYFPTVALLNSQQRRRAIFFWGVVFAIIGTSLTIAQSLHGLSNLFDSEFYTTGAWSGNKHMVGSMVRVNLPISNWIAFVLLVIFAKTMMHWNFKAVFLSVFLAVAILLNFARSLWLGMIIASLVIYLRLYRLRMISSSSIVGLGVMVVTLALAYASADALGVTKVTGAVVERLDEGIHFFKNNTGTWGVRMQDTEMAMRLWKDNWLWGLGTNYPKAIGQWLDMGIAIVLVSIGTIGLLGLLWLFYKSWSVGMVTMREGSEQGSETSVIAGASLIGQIVLMIVYQQWLTPYVMSILAISGGICVSYSVSMTGVVNESNWDSSLSI